MAQEEIRTADGFSDKLPEAAQDQDVYTFESLLNSHAPKAPE